MKRIYFIATNIGLFCTEAESCAEAQMIISERTDGKAAPIKANVLESLSKEQALDLARRATVIEGGAASRAKLKELSEDPKQPLPASRDDVAEILAGKSTIALPPG